MTENKTFWKCVKIIAYPWDLLSRVAWLCINGEWLRKNKELPTRKNGIYIDYVKDTPFDINIAVHQNYKKCKYINMPFYGCDQHHMDDNTIICIPRNIHRGVFHNRHTWMNMDIINGIAIAWVEQNISVVCFQQEKTCR